MSVRYEKAVKEIAWENGRGEVIELGRGVQLWVLLRTAMN
jgi:hypothetical protein